MVGRIFEYSNIEYSNIENSKFEYSDSRTRVIATDFRPCISSLGPNRKFYFLNISTCAGRRATKLTTNIHMVKGYPTMFSLPVYHFRFRHRAPLKNFSFLRFSQQRRHLAELVVPRCKGLVTHYNMDD